MLVSLDLPRLDQEAQEDSIEELQSDHSNTNTAELYLYKGWNMHRRIGMSDVTTIVVDNESHFSDVYVECSDDYYCVQDEEIEKPIYDFISNSVFALSLLKEDGNVLDLDASDNPDCYICKNECRFS